MKLTNTVLPVGHRSNSCVIGVTPVYEENRKEKRKKIGKFILVVLSNAVVCAIATLRLVINYLHM
jgi:hypothetical protein